MADISDYSGRLRAAEWEVRSVPIDVGRTIVEQLHYARGASKVRVYIHGLFQIGHNECKGVAWWLPPTRAAALASYPSKWQGVLSLSRLAVSPDVPANGCTFLLSRSRRLINRATWPCLVTYADTWRGHTGTIYKADNWEYCGLTQKKMVYLIGDRMTATKCGSKSRTHKEMLDLGAVCMGKYAKHKYRHIVGGKLP